ncbi:MAG TPA: hypothetical protein DCM05_03460 [Elusimicrobia bacterium]|nr:hypothetical protein [Elusimicrobiota bacterium]
MKLTNRNKKVTPEFASAVTSNGAETKPVVTKVRKAVKTAPYSIEVQYPQEGEKVYKGHYAIRVDVLNVANVHISINNGDWQSCRETSGHYWFDWYPSEAGSFRLVARATGPDGRETKSTIRTCKVI